LPRQTAKSQTCLEVRFCSQNENPLRHLDAEIIAADSPAEATAPWPYNTETRSLRTSAWKGMADLTPNPFLGIPIIEVAAPSGFPAQQERELYSQIQAAIDMLRCASCGSLNYKTTLFVFAACVEKMIECRNCGDVHQEILYNDGQGLLGFLPSRVCASHGFQD